MKLHVIYHVLIGQCGIGYVLQLLFLRMRCDMEYIIFHLLSNWIKNICQLSLNRLLILVLYVTYVICRLLIEQVAMCAAIALFANERLHGVLILIFHLIG